jgi:FkbM family methyltransferase
VIKRFIVKSFLFYSRYFPIQKGKAAIGRIISRIIFTVKIRSKLGFDLLIFPNSLQDQSFLDSRNLEDQSIVKEISSLNKNGVFIDIGANIGFYSLMASLQVGPEGKVFSFEPSPREYWRFLYNIIENKATSIIPFNIGIADKSQLVDFCISETHTGLNKIVGDNNLSVSGRTIKVPMMKLDDVIDHYNIREDIDLVKIDIEGAELFALQGMQNLLRNNKIRRIIIEITPELFAGYNYCKNDVYDFLGSFSYKSLRNLETAQYDEIFTLKN